MQNVSANPGTSLLPSGVIDLTGNASVGGYDPGQSFGSYQQMQGSHMAGSIGTAASASAAAAATVVTQTAMNAAQQSVIAGQQAQHATQQSVVAGQQAQHAYNVGASALQQTHTMRVVKRDPNTCRGYVQQGVLLQGSVVIFILLFLG